MKFDSHLIHDLILTWQESSQEDVFNQINGILSHYVYFFPKLSYRAPEDICAEFYLFVEKNIKDILKSYPRDSQVYFKTWFNQVLIYKYADFCKDSPFDEIQNSPLIEDMVSLSIEENTYDLTCLENHEKALLIFYQNPKDLNHEHMMDISSFCKCDFSSLLDVYAEMCVLHEQSKNKNISDNIILDNLERKMFKLQHRLEKDQRTDKQELLFKVERLKNRHRRISHQKLQDNKKVLRLLSSLFDSSEKAHRTFRLIKQKLHYYSKLKGKGK